MLSLEKPLPRLPFLATGVALLVLKVPIDLLIARAFDRPFSLLFYVSPLDNPVLIPPSWTQAWANASGGVSGYWLTLVGVALPFILAGVALCLRRLRDAGLPGALALFFFLPFVKFIFFAALAAVPSKDDKGRVVAVDDGPFRSVKIDLPPSEKVHREGRRHALAMLLGSLAGDGVALASMGVSVGLLGSYGAPLMIATPAVAGFVGTFVYCRLCRPTFWGAILVTVLTFVFALVGLGASAYEGLGCIVMASPLFFAETLVGTFLAYSLAKTMPEVPYKSLASGAFILPLTFAAGGASPLPPEDAQPVESSVIVHAPPDVVWKRVIAFPPLAPPTEAIFRAGIAAPLAATIEGEGVGAVRRCEFTTGTFVEPIEVWNPGRELRFSVTSQPDPMQEWTLYPGPRPPHLNGYLQLTGGQFLLEPLADGSTRLIGRTWYRVHMEPLAYWRFWSDRIIHRIHLRVLEHVAALAEADVRQAGRATSEP